MVSCGPPLHVEQRSSPQGGISSTALFIFYLASMPMPIDNSIKRVTYADDITLLCLGDSVSDSCVKINEYLNILHQWLTEKHLTLFTEKSTPTL